MAAEPGVDGRVFVVGVPRSGTTLVQSLLAAHSATTSFTETHFFDRHFTLPTRFLGPILKRNPGPRLDEFLAENDEVPPGAARWFEGRGSRLLGVRPLLPFQTGAVARQLLRVLDELTLRRGRSSWIEKTPRHLRYVPFLERVSGPAPRARFVHVIRDGLEVVASLHRASQSWERPYDLDACVRRWNADVGFSLGRVGAPDDHFVFYEELTSRPEATLRRLLTDLGLGWEPGILEQHGRTAHRLITKEEPWKGDVGRSIRTSGTSHRGLTAEERERVTRTLRPCLYQQLREGVGRRSGAGDPAR
jgi:hypothetical protein